MKLLYVVNVAAWMEHLIKLEEKMKYVIAIIGLLVVLGLALLASNNKKQVRYRPIILMIVIQIILAALLLNTEFGLIFIKWIANIFVKSPIMLNKAFRLCLEESPIKENLLSS